MISDVLCNIAESANGLNNLDAASSALCEDVDVSSTTKRELLEISPRRLSEVNMNDRTDNNVEPTIAYALRGVLDVCCFQTPHLFENPVTNSRCFRVI
jgi:chitinase